MLDQASHVEESAFCFNQLTFFLPIPEILLASVPLTTSLKPLKFGAPSEFMNWTSNPPSTSKHRKETFSLFVQHIGNLHFNIKYVPKKYIQRFTQYGYQHKVTIHPLFPLYTGTQHNSWITNLKKEFNIINPYIEIKIFPLGFVETSFAFITTQIPIADDLERIKQRFFGHIRKIKKSIINALYSPKVVENIFTQIIPEKGYYFHILMSSSSSSDPLKLSSEWKDLGKYNLGKFALYCLHEKRFLLLPWKISRILRKDMLLPLKWAVALESIFDIYTRKIIEWLQNSNFSVQEYENLWLTVAHSLNPSIHFPGFAGKSPYFVHSYQKKIFRKVAQLFELESKYTNLIKSIKHQSPSFFPLAHHTIINLEKQAKLDPRLKLLVGIRSNLKRTPIREFTGPSSEEEQIIAVLLEKYEKDYRKMSHGYNIGTLDMGWMVLREIGREMGWKDNKIYSSDKYNLKRIILTLFEKELVATKTFSQGRQLYCRINPNNDYIRLQIGKTIHRLN